MRKQIVKGKLRWVKETPGENVKIRNATPIEVNGIRFRSKLEACCYEQMFLKGLKPLYEEETFVLQEKFEYCGEKDQLLIHQTLQEIIILLNVKVLLTMRKLEAP